MTAPRAMFCSKGDTMHAHLSVEEAAACWGTPSLYVFGGAGPLVTPSPIAATPAPVKRIPKRSGGRPWSTLNQLKYIRDLGGDVVYAEYMTKHEASVYIDGMKSERYETGIVETVDEFTGKPRRWNRDLTGPASIDEAPSRPIDSLDEITDAITGEPWAAKRETIVPVPLLEMVPHGYYATQLEEDADVTFLRVKKPTMWDERKGIKLIVQTQHGERLEDAFVVYNDGRVDVLKVSVEEAINLLISDQYGAARRYAKLISRCCRCNKELTDDRSRKYGIGPECEKHMRWMIDLVDMESEA